MNDQAQEYEEIMPQEKPGNNLVELMTRAEIDTQIATAKQYPRSVKQFLNDAMAMVTLNESVAQSCNYGLPRGGKIITGPSVRFAEIIYSAWGNSRAGTRIVHEDSRFITAQGICHDLQRNTMITMDVKRRITDKYGKTYNDDMIGVTGNAASSVALRNAILRVIPKAFWEPLYEESRKVAMGDSKTLATRRADALAVMQKFGASEEMILTKFELKGVEDITLEHLQVLNACRNSIKNGETTVEALFAIPVTEKKPDETKGTDAVKDKLKKKAAKAAGADPQTGEIKDDKKPEPKAEEKKPEPKMTRAEGLHPGEDPGITEEMQKPKSPVFSTAQIPMKGSPEDNTQPDFDGWRLEFMRRCNTAPSLAEIATLYKQNANLLTQMKSRKPAYFDECERCYNDAVENLKEMQHVD